MQTNIVLFRMEKNINSLVLCLSKFKILKCFKSIQYEDRDNIYCTYLQNSCKCFAIIAIANNCIFM